MKQVVLLAILLAVAGVAGAQTQIRVRGTITAVEGDMLSVKSREGKDLKIEIAPNAVLGYMKQLSLADVKPGTPLGTSALNGADGKLVALVEAGNGRELTLSYKEGSQRVVVPANIPIVTGQAGERSLLVVGEYAYIAATVAADGKISAQRLVVSKGGVRPPQ